MPLKNNLTAFIMIGNTSESMYQSFSDTNSRMFAHAANVLEAADTIDPVMWIIAGSIYIIYGIYYCLFIGINLFCELSLGVLMLFAPLIIPISAFQCARGMGKGWLVAIIKYVCVSFGYCFHYFTFQRYFRFINHSFNG